MYSCFRSPAVQRFRSNSKNTSLRMSSNFKPGKDGYLSVHVTGSLVKGSEQAFYLATLKNAMNSVKEIGISRFDCMKRIEYESETGHDEFMLIETFNKVEGPAEHKETLHYNEWRETVAPFMATPRSAIKYKTLFPHESCFDVAPSAGDINVDEYTTSDSNSNDGSAWSSSLQEAYDNSKGMLAVIVNIAVKPEFIQEFIQASKDNCQNSMKEAGVHRFDLLQNIEDETNFILVEVYNSIDAPPLHKETTHYHRWASKVKDMMARPRTNMKYKTLFPSPLHWHTSAKNTHLGEGAEGWASTVDFGLTGVREGATTGFSFLSPKISMGRGIVSKALASSIKSYNMKNPLIVTGASGLSRYNHQLGEEMYTLLSSSTMYKVPGEPTVDQTLEAVTLAQNNKHDGVIAIGGGSALDLGKAVAALMTNIGTDYDNTGTISTIYTYLESVGEGKPILNPPVPFIAVPTTSGTGSEATKNAVIKCTKKNRKASIRSDDMLPNVAILDPLLTVSCPSDVTAHVGLDTLCQVIEPYVSCYTNPIVDALAREGILRASRSLRLVVTQCDNIEAREDLAVASLLGGLSLANAKLGAVHGFAGVLGGLYDTPHGLICAALLPHVFRMNSEKLKEKSIHDDSALELLERFNEIGRVVTGNKDATANDGALWLEAILIDLNVPKLRKYMPSDANLHEIALATSTASSTKGNPIELSVEELTILLKKAY